MATINPGPTRDSDYSRKYIKKGTYPQAARSTSAKAIYNNVIAQHQGYSEFKPGNERTSTAAQRAYEVFMRQSEFKKPYRGLGGYPEMETNADPPPGISSFKFDNPATPSVDTPIVPDDFDDPFHIVFNAWLDPDYEEGGYCRGNTVNCLFHATEPIYEVRIGFSKPGTSIVVTSPFGLNDLYLDISADNGEWGFITLYFLLRSYEGVGAEINVNVFGKVCEEYCLVRMEGPVADKVTVWGMIEDAVVSNIPTNDLTGVVSFPADFSEIATWLEMSSSLAEQALMSGGTPGWLDDPLSIDTPDSPNNGNSCSFDLNSYNGGSWPKVDINDTPVSGGDGVGCDSPTLINQNYERWEYRQSVNCPAGSLKADPYVHIEYWEGDWIRRAQKISAELTSNNLVPATQMFRTELIGHSYNYFTESADYTPKPNPSPPPATIPTSLGGGSYNGYMFYTYNVYSPLDSSPMVEANHTAICSESWSKTFALNGTVSGFTRTFEAEGIPRDNYQKVQDLGYSQVFRQGSIYGRHTAVQVFIWEALRVAATIDSQAGPVGNENFNSWESNAQWGVTDIDVYQGVHVGSIFDEETYTDNLDACTLTRNNGFESAVEDLIDAYKTDAGLGSDDVVPTNVTLGLAILL
jgi:hypothetical protein